ncbi:hypothetical protein MMC11_006680 [Xylographa trunciseda]|nr:hypothetical protein [Xylographa trunciseda]
MVEPYLVPWTLPSNSSCDGANIPVAGEQSSKRRKIHAYVPNSSVVQLTQRRDTSSTLIGRTEPLIPARFPNGIVSFDGRGTEDSLKSLEDNGVHSIRQSVYSTRRSNDAEDAEQQEMDPEIISRLVEMADSDPRLMHLVEVLDGGKASVSEKKEWNRYYSSLSPSARPPEAVQCKKSTGSVVAQRISPKAIPILSETLHSVQPSRVTSFHSAGPVSNELSPPYSPTDPQHDEHPTKYSQEDDVVFLHERPRTPPIQAAAPADIKIASSPLFVSPGKPLVVKKSRVAPVADPFAQAKRKRAQAEAELEARQRASGSRVTKEVKVVGRQTSTLSASRGPVSQRILSPRVQNLDDRITEYRTELQQKEIKIQNLRAEVDRGKSEHRLSLKKSEKEVADLKIEVREYQRAAEVAQIKTRKPRVNLERMPRAFSGNVPATVSATQDITSIELANLRSEVSALRSLVTAKDQPYSEYAFVHRNLLAAPLFLRGRERTVSTSGRGSPSKSASSPTDSDTGTNCLEHVERNKEKEEDTHLTMNEKAVREFDKAVGLPQNPIPVRVDGMLAYRDGTRDANGRLPRAKNLFKVGRNVPGELK